METKGLYGLEDDKDQSKLVIEDLNYASINVSHDSLTHKLEQTANESSSHTLLMNNAEERSDFLTAPKPTAEP